MKKIILFVFLFLAPVLTNAEYLNTYICREKHGEYATFRYPYLECSCLDGFGKVNANSRCVEMEIVCKANYGNMSIYDYNSKSCLCLSGYQFNDDRTSCVELKKTVNIILISTSSLPLVSSYKRTLKYGSIGKDVSLLQENLKRLGMLSKEIETTQFFGVKTREAVIKFQKLNDIYPQEGIFGPLTQKAILLY